MATFAYRAIDQTGRRCRGTITAASGRHARQQLRGSGLRVESVAERASSKRQTLTIRRTGRYRNQLTDAIRELSTLLHAGVSLLDAIDSLLPQTRGGFHDAMLAVRDKVSSGSSLADAMADEPTIFDEMTIGMVRVGEHAGNLDEVCEHIAGFRERSGQLKDRVISALLYPMIVMVISVAVTVFLMTVVVPMLLQNLLEMGQDLPLPTLILKWISDTLLDYGPFVFVALALLMVGLVAHLRTESGRVRLDRVALTLPIVGTLVQKQALSRMALVVSSLLRSGVELVDALAIAERSATNRLLRSALSEMQEDLKLGRDLRESAQKHPIFSHSIAQVFALGQQSGQLDRMLQRLGEDYDRQAEQLATRMTTILEPALIVMLSIVVGFILFATVLPILEAGNVLAG